MHTERLPIDLEATQRQLDAARQELEEMRGYLARGHEVVTAAFQVMARRPADYSADLVAMVRNVARTVSAGMVSRQLRVQLQARYGRHGRRLLVMVMDAPMTQATQLQKVLTSSRSELRSALDALPADAHQAVRAALVAALAALDELHNIATTGCKKTQEIVDVSAGEISSCAHAPPALVRCSHHRRHLVASSTSSTDPAPARTAGAASRRRSHRTGGNRLPT